MFSVFGSHCEGLSLCWWHGRAVLVARAGLLVQEGADESGDTAKEGDAGKPNGEGDADAGVDGSDENYQVNFSNFGIRKKTKLLYSSLVRYGPYS